MLTINIGGKERPIKMKMLAVKTYRKLTGVNIAGKDYTRLTDIIGDKEKEFDPDLFVAFLYSVLANGCHPAEPDFTLEDVADWVNLYDRQITAKLAALYLQEMTGKTTDEINSLIGESERKNPPAPEGAMSGTTSNELLTAV